MAKNVSQQIVELLEKAGVKRVYAVTGDSLNFFNIAVKESKEIEQRQIIPIVQMNNRYSQNKQEGIGEDNNSARQNEPYPIGESNKDIKYI